MPTDMVRGGEGRRGGNSEYSAANGVGGLKALGVRDLNYRLSFLASSVQSTHAAVSPSDAIFSFVYCLLFGHRFVCLRWSVTVLCV